MSVSNSCPPCPNTNSASSISSSYTTKNVQDRNDTSQSCHTQTGINDLNSKIDKCTSTSELNRNLNFAKNTIKFEEDIVMLRATIGDSLLMGDAIYGKHGVDDIAKQVKARNNELKTKKDILMNDIDKKEAIIERSNRDFSDVKDTIPEIQKKTYINFIEDYTLASVVTSYLFMIISVIYIYTLKSYELSSKDSYTSWVSPLLQSIIGSSFLTCFMYIILYYFS